MNGGTHTLDPNVEEILVEIAGQPGSRLLRMTPEQRAAAARGESLELIPYATGLTAAERHLLRVCRAEVAYLLRTAYWNLLLRDEAHEARVKHDFEVEDVADRRQRVERELEWAPSLRAWARTNELLGRCLAARIDRAPKRADYLIAALQLEDTGEARNDLALEWILAGELENARATFEKLTTGVLTQKQEQICWHNIGFLHTSRGDDGRAVDAFAISATIDGGDPETDFNLLRCALRLGDSTLAARAAARVDEQVSADDPDLARFAAASLTDHETPTAKAHACLRGLRDRLGPASRKIADAYA